MMSLCVVTAGRQREDEQNIGDEAVDLSLLNTYYIVSMLRSKKDVPHISIMLDIPLLFPLGDRWCQVN